MDGYIYLTVFPWSVSTLPYKVFLNKGILFKVSPKSWSWKATRVTFRTPSGLYQLYEIQCVFSKSSKMSVQIRYWEQIIKGDKNYSHQEKWNLFTNLLTFIYTPFNNKKDYSI